MRYPASAPLALLLLCQLAFPSFTFLYASSGNLTTDTDTYYAFSQPSSLYLVGSRLYAADSGRGMIYALDTLSSLDRAKTISSADDYLNNPMHMDYDSPSGALYIAGGTTGNIIYYSGEGSSVDKWNPGTTNLQKASGIALSNDTVYIADGVRGQVVAYSRATKAYSRVVIQQGGSDGLLSSPNDILFHEGKLYVSDSSKGLVFVYDANFTFQYAIGRGKGGVNLVSPRGMDFDENRLYVADANAGQVVAFSLDGYPVDILNSSTEGGSLSYPEDVIADNGVLYVADTQNRQVKAFLINKTGGDPAVLAMIAEANATCAGMASIQSVASSLNVTFTPIAYGASLSSAMQYYDAYAFSSASTIAGKAKADCADAQSSVSQGVELRIRQIVQSAQSQVAPYRNASATSASSLAQFDNKASAALFALTSKSYASAADIALSLPQLAGAIAAGSEEKAAQEEEKRQNQSSSLISAEITAVSSRLSRLQEKSDAYRQGINLSGSRDLIMLAQKNAQNGDFDSANRSLELALLEIATYETMVDASSKEIDAALSSLAIIEIEFNATASSPMLFAPDVSKERALLSQAKESVYSTPQAALQTAMQAKASAEAKSRDSQAISLAATGVIVVLALIGLIAAGFFIHIMGRKRKGDMK
ncbi:MAG: NHL repeat-containing protein [Candidatus Micrarchaeia archaeon]|jgi:sugar lactone lactonase YvrE